jgi:hypothetical protein
LQYSKLRGWRRRLRRADSDILVTSRDSEVGADLETLWISLLAVHERIIGLAERLLGVRDIRIYSAEAWAKYTGAADYDQALHRDYLNHTILIPSADAACQHAEFFLYLSDVPEELGPPHFVSRSRTAALPAKPNWYPRAARADDEYGWVAHAGSPDLYESEASAAGPAGTVLAFQLGTFHRGTAMTHRVPSPCTGLPAEGGRQGQRTRGRPRHDPFWYEFVSRASPRRAELFGFPPPGHVLDWRHL